MKDPVHRTGDVMAAGFLTDSLTEPLDNRDSGIRENQLTEHSCGGSYG